MRTLYIDGFFVFGFALTTMPVTGPSSPRFSISLISARTLACPRGLGTRRRSAGQGPAKVRDLSDARMILGRRPSRKVPFAAADRNCGGHRAPLGVLREKHRTNENGPAWPPGRHRRILTIARGRLINSAGIRSDAARAAPILPPAAQV